MIVTLNQRIIVQNLQSSKSFLDVTLHFVHKPSRCGCRSTYPDALLAGENTHVDFLDLRDEIGALVHRAALLEEDFAVAAFGAAHKEDNIVALGKFLDFGDAVGYLAADGIVVLEADVGRDVRLDILYNTAKLVERLGGL